MDFFETKAGRRLAYEYVPGNGPGVVFLGGFMSDMTGSKASDLSNWARESGRAYLRFDYSGHGQSSGAFTDGSIGDWTEDAVNIISDLTRGPQILVGSSMGGWISLLVMKTIPQRVAGFVGIAAAPDFTDDMFNHALTEEQRAEVMGQGQTLLASEYDEPYPITKKLIEDGREHFVMGEVIPCSVPVRLLIARGDAVVRTETQLALLDVLETDDARLTVVKGGDHSFSGPAELRLLRKTVHSVTQAIAGQS
ncbi:MAG: alpha/beta fold hydrolase [Pseudomonadota bacterium]